MARLKVPSDRPSGFYHCLSRVVDRRQVLDDSEKDRFVALMRETERFARVRILTHCVLDNHFHLLVEVPQRPASLPGPDEIVEDLERLTGHQNPEAVRQRFDKFRQDRDEAGLAAYLASFHARMYDVSAFMKRLKQRFTQNFNSRHGRTGTLWEDRFKSVLVEGAGEALATMAAYIDLNPVRAGIVPDPKDYRWSGYGEAMAGRKLAKLGVQRIVTALLGGHQESPAQSLKTYRRYLYLEGDERREALGSKGNPERDALRAEQVAEVLEAKGQLPVTEYLRCRVRYFSDGAVFGGREFVEGIFREHRERFGPKRKSGARSLRGLSTGALFTLRDLRRKVFGTGTNPP